MKIWEGRCWFCRKNGKWDKHRKLYTLFLHNTKILHISHVENFFHMKIGHVKNLSTSVMWRICIRGWMITLAAFVCPFSTVCHHMCPHIVYISGHILALIAFYVFSPLCAIICLLILSTSVDTYSHWLHLFVFSPLWIFKCFLKSPAWDYNIEDLFCKLNWNTNICKWNVLKTRYAKPKQVSYYWKWKIILMSKKLFALFVVSGQLELGLKTLTTEGTRESHSID